MGFLSLIPATDLAAVYNPFKRTLTISARGTAQKYTSSIHFTRLPFPGGLKFELQGWVGPIAQSKQPYEVSDDITIQLPSRALPSGTVVIITSNWPEGKVVPIHWLGADGKKEPLVVPEVGGHGSPRGSGYGGQGARSSGSSSGGVSAAADSPTPVGPFGHGFGPGPVVLPKTHKISVMVEGTFTLKADSDVPKFGSVDIKYDQLFLKLISASIEDKSIVWEFEAIQSGQTSVRVTTTGGIAEFVSVAEYDVTCWLPLGPFNPLGPIGPIIISGKGIGAGDATTGGTLTAVGGGDAAINLDPTTISDASKAGITEILSYLGRVFIAWRIVTATYPSATLLSVTATLPKGVTKPTTNPLDLSQLRAIFNIPSQTKPQETLFISSTGWGSWGQPVVKQEPWVGAQEFRFPPVQGMIDIVDAARLVKEKGHTEGFWSVDLRKLEAEVVYIFYMVGGEAVLVSVNGRNVVVNEAGQALLPTAAGSSKLV